MNADPKDYPLLAASLEVAVPIWIAEFKRLGKEHLADDERERLLRLIMEHGDDIIFKSHRKGGTANAFNALAEALAWLSYAPGGVTFLGMHWETKP